MAGVPAEIQKLYDTFQPKAKDILSAQRIVNEGAVKIIEKDKAKDCTMYLLDNAAFLVNSQNEIQVHISLKQNLTFPDQEGALFCIKTPKKSMSFEAASEEEKKEWVNAFLYTLDGLVLPVFKEIDGNTVWDPIGSLTERERNIFEEFKTIFSQQQIPDEEGYCDDAMFIKYLRARSWDIQKSLQMLKDTLEWRKTYKPQETTIEDIAEEHKTGWVYSGTGKDKLGRPLVYCRAHFDVRPHSPAKVRHLVKILEDSIKLCNSKETGVEKIVWLVDLGGPKEAKLSEIKDGVKTAIEVVNIFQAHYPERLGRAFMIDAPTAFEFGWRMVSPFIDPITQRRFIFVKRKKNIAEMLDLFESEQLEEQFGGSNTFKFDYEAWKAEKLAQTNE